MSSAVSAAGFAVLDSDDDRHSARIGLATRAQGPRTRREPYHRASVVRGRVSARDDAAVVRGREQRVETSQLLPDDVQASPSGRRIGDDAGEAALVLEPLAIERDVLAEQHSALTVPEEERLVPRGVPGGGHDAQVS